MALNLANQAVNCAPSEFITWARLTDAYLDLEDYKSALLTLNSCPMFTFNHRDVQRMPQPAKVNLPQKPDIQALGSFEDEVPNTAEVKRLTLLSMRCISVCLIYKFFIIFLA